MLSYKYLVGKDVHVVAGQKYSWDFFFDIIEAQSNDYTSTDSYLYTEALSGYFSGSGPKNYFTTDYKNLNYSFIAFLYTVGDSTSSPLYVDPSVLNVTFNANLSVPSGYLTTADIFGSFYYTTYYAYERGEPGIKDDSAGPLFEKYASRDGKIYIDGKPLFTSGSDSVDFNKLDSVQNSAVANGAKLTDSLGGTDTIYLPTNYSVSANSKLSVLTNTLINTGAGSSTVYGSDASAIIAGIDSAGHTGVTGSKQVYSAGGDVKVLFPEGQTAYKISYSTKELFQTAPKILAKVIGGSNNEVLGGGVSAVFSETNSKLSVLNTKTLQDMAAVEIVFGTISKSLEYITKIPGADKAAPYVKMFDFMIQSFGAAAQASASPDALRYIFVESIQILIRADKEFLISQLNSAGAPDFIKKNVATAIDNFAFEAKTQGGRIYDQVLQSTGTATDKVYSALELVKNALHEKAKAIYPFIDSLSPQEMHNAPSVVPGFSNDGIPTPSGEIIISANALGSKVYALYDGLLGRAPDSLGLEGWTATLKAGATLHDIAAAFLASPEGQARAGAADNAIFVEQLYQANLHRAADPGGLSGWVSALNAGASRTDIALGFALSNEHIVNLKSVFDAGIFVPDQGASNVARLYHSVLDRAPDAGGLQGWTGAVKAGASLHDVATTFLKSSEYEVATTGRTDAQFVTDLYQQVLDRAGDSQGVQGWNGYLDAGGARGVVIDGFTNSFEFQGKYAGQGSVVYVEGLYEHILGRPGDSAGLQGWANTIDSGLASRTDVAHAFTGSAEFQAKYVGPSNADFVDDLYDNALGRHADVGSLQGWTDALAQGTSRADVAVAIAQSAEAQQHLVSVIEQGWQLA